MSRWWLETNWVPYFEAVVASLIELRAQHPTAQYEVTDGTGICVSSVRLFLKVLLSSIYIPEVPGICVLACTTAP